MTSALDASQIGLALENVPVPMFAHDETGRVRFVSKEWLRATGYTREQMPTLRAWLELAYRDPAVVARVLEAHRDGYSGEPRALHNSGEYRVRIADGSTRLWMFRAYSIGRGRDGLAINISMALDVTEERASANALARSEARLRQALRVGGVGNFERDSQRRFTEYSDELMKLHGLPETERRENYERWFARVHPADRSRVVAYAEGLGDDNAVSAIEYRIARADGGGWRRVAERREPVRDASGRPIGSIGLQRDVTETRAAEEALRDSEARLRMSLEVGQVGVFDWDLATDELIWDRRVRDIWGLADGEPVTIAEFYRGLHREDVAPVEAAVRESHDSAGSGLYDIVYRVIHRRDGNTRHVNARGRTLFENGRATRMMGVAVDITPQREAASVLERDRDELERLVAARTRELADAQTRLADARRMEALGQLAGGIAHDFNNVLQAVEAAADLIERRPEAEHLPRYIKMAREATKRGSAISRRLSSLSKRAELEPERVETSQWLERFAASLRPGLSVTVDCPPDCPALFVDRRQLETALGNLAANAREAMGPEGALTLRARAQTPAEAEASPWRATLRPGEYVRIEAIDTGRGMTEEVRARAAEPFFTTKPRGQGAGLGLSMARGFADQSGGALKIDSEPGQGARIALWLPVAQSPAVAAPEERNSEGGRLLVVDDDPLVRELIGEHLRVAGYAVTICELGRAALERLDGGLSVDLLLTDFSMPEMNGVTLAREARKRRPGLPVVVLTGYANEAAEAMGKDDFALLGKPIDSRALVRRVAELIRNG